jgi:hypothetical protein
MHSGSVCILFTYLFMVYSVMLSVHQIGWYVEESDHGLIEVLSQHLS